MFSNVSSIASFDSELHEAIKNEENRQEQHIELIASENIASKVFESGLISKPNSLFFSQELTIAIVAAANRIKNKDLR